MAPQPSDSPRKPLVSVEFQTEVDVATGSRQRRMFVKMYFGARDSGLLAAIPGELWKMLCCLATYMNEDGNCYPTQDCQRRSESTSVGRSENASVRGAEESWFDFRQGEREGDLPLAVAASG